MKLRKLLLGMLAVLAFVGFVSPAHAYWVTDYKVVSYTNVNDVNNASGMGFRVDAQHLSISATESGAGNQCSIGGGADHIVYLWTNGSYVQAGTTSLDASTSRYCHWEGGGSPDSYLDIEMQYSVTGTDDAAHSEWNHIWAIFTAPLGVKAYLAAHSTEVFTDTFTPDNGAANYNLGILQGAMTSQFYTAQEYSSPSVGYNVLWTITTHVEEDK